ncbi:MAG: ABC transporter ATP-binding protein [Kiritimatiellia bacterium]|nr:ABC transporter ATP-binding protein [Kiritimatiellia bacterium]
MASSVRFENVVKTFGTVRAVDGIHLSIEPGELFFLLGPSGCGKTTLLRCLAGFVEPDSGRIRIDDRDITRDPPYRRDTGMVFQSYALWPHLTLRENVAFGLRIRRVPEPERTRRVDEALDLVLMRDRADARPNQISGGQQQRVALARALVVRPRCLLLDEPLSNLDAKLRLEMRSEIRRICKEAGLTALYVTHDQKEALSMADRLAVLRDGRMEQCGSPRDVYARPANRFVAGFIGETNFIEGQVTAYEGDRLHVSSSTGPWVAVAGATRPVLGDRVVLSVRPESVRLEDRPAGSVNRFEGSVHDTLYLGEMAQHLVDIVTVSGTAGASLKVFEIRPRFEARDGQRCRAVFHVPPEDVVALPAETA